MRERTIAIPRLLHVGPDCLSALAPLLKESSFDLTRILVGSGSGPSVKFADQALDGLRHVGLDASGARGLAGRLDQAAELAASVISDGVTLLVAVGGGRVIDTVKLAAARTGTDFVSVPTAISHDGISSPVASLVPKEGARQSYAASMPGGIIVDVGVIGSAPPRTLRAGVGDLVSNLTALLDWRRADRLGHARFDAFSAMIAEHAARPVLDLEDLGRPESHELIAKGLLMSGLAMAAAGTSRPCSGAEHLISHSLDEILGERAAMHGEQVALGCLVAAAAHDSPLRSTLMSFFSQLRLPTAPGDLGVTEHELTEAIRAAPATRPDRYTDSLRRARAAGRSCAAPRAGVRHPRLIAAAPIPSWEERSSELARRSG